jgi:hypothetical protein
MERVTRARRSGWASLWKMQVTRRNLVVGVVAWWLLAAGWIWISVRGGTFPVGLLWTANAALQTWMAWRCLAWLRSHEEPAEALAEGERRAGRLEAFVAESPAWPVKVYAVDAFWVEVVLDGEERVRSLPRYATDVYDDPRVRVGLPLELKVLGDEIAIDWDATLAAEQQRDTSGRLTSIT